MQKPINFTKCSSGPKNVHLKNPIVFLFTFWPKNKQTADVEKNVEGIK